MLNIPNLKSDDTTMYSNRKVNTALQAAPKKKGYGWGAGESEAGYNKETLLFQYSSKHPEASTAAAAFVTSKLQTRRQKMIVFDKDGTLGNCTDALRRWAHHMTGRIQKVLTTDAEGTQQLVDKFHALIGWDSSADDLLPSAPLAAGIWDDQVTTVFEFLMEHQDKHDEGASWTRERAKEWHDELGSVLAEDAPLVDDLRAMMMACRNLGYKVAICTSDDRSATDVAMKFWDIHDLVDVSICGDEVAECKPSAEPLHHVCRLINSKGSFQFRPEDCVVVGDTTSDTGMARNAKAGFCVGVLTGSGTTEQLLGTGAHLTLPNVGHIPALLHTFENLLAEKNDLQ